MPTANEHYDKYCHNKNLLSSELFDPNKAKNHDWAITISFYSALHIVEKKCAELGQTHHFKGHLERNNFVLRVKDFKPIAAKYHTLYNQSRRARYDCVDFSKDDVKEVFNLLSDIEHELL